MTRARPLFTLSSLLFAAWLISIALAGVGCGDQPCVRHSDCGEGLICGATNRCVVKPIVDMLGPDGDVDGDADLGATGEPGPDLARPPASPDLSASPDLASGDLASGDLSTADMKPAGD